MKSKFNWRVVITTLNSGKKEYTPERCFNRDTMSPSWIRRGEICDSAAKAEEYINKEIGKEVYKISMYTYPKPTLTLIEHRVE